MGKGEKEKYYRRIERKKEKRGSKPLLPLSLLLFIRPLAKLISGGLSERPTLEDILITLLFVNLLRVVTNVCPDGSALDFPFYIMNNDIIKTSISLYYQESFILRLIHQFFWSYSLICFLILSYNEVIVHA